MYVCVIFLLRHPVKGSVPVPGIVADVDKPWLLYECVAFSKAGQRRSVSAQ